MTATADFRQVAQYIGLAICALIMRTALWVFGILWGIVREIVNGMFRVAIGIIVAIFPLSPSSASSFGYSPFNPYRHEQDNEKKCLHGVYVTS